MNNFEHKIFQWNVFHILMCTGSWYKVRYCHWLTWLLEFKLRFGGKYTDRVSRLTIHGICFFRFSVPLVTATSRHTLVSIHNNSLFFPCSSSTLQSSWMNHVPTWCGELGSGWIVRQDTWHAQNKRSLFNTKNRWRIAPKQLNSKMCLKPRYF